MKACFKDLMLADEIIRILNSNHVKFNFFLEAEGMTLYGILTIPLFTACWVDIKPGFDKVLIEHVRKEIAKDEFYKNRKFHNLVYCDISNA